MSLLHEYGGFIPLGGSARRYLDMLTGKEYSRREAERIIERMSDIDRELRYMASLSARTGSIVRDYAGHRDISVFDIDRRSLRDIREVFDLFKTKDAANIDKALRMIGRRKDDETPTS